MVLSNLMNAIGLRARATPRNPTETTAGFKHLTLLPKPLAETTNPMTLPIFGSGSRYETRESDVQQLETKLKSYNLKQHGDGKISFEIPAGGSFYELLKDAQRLIEIKFGETWMISRRFLLEAYTEDAEKTHPQKSTIKIQLDTLSREVFDINEANRLIAKTPMVLPSSLELMAVHALCYARSKEDIFRGNKLLCSGEKVLGFNRADAEFGGFWVTAMTAHTLHFCMPSVSRE